MDTVSWFSGRGLFWIRWGSLGVYLKVRFEGYSVLCSGIVKGLGLLFFLFIELGFLFREIRRGIYFLFILLGFICIKLVFLVLDFF